MKKMIFLSIFLFLYSCITPENYRYKVVNQNKEHLYIYTFYTNSIEFKGDTMGYYNSWGDFVIMSEERGSDCTIDTLIK